MINTAELTLAELFSKELLETNGLGSYSSMSICGANTRKYHGILVASSNPPTERRVLVAKVEERIQINGRTLDLSVNQYPEQFIQRAFNISNLSKRRPVAQWKYGEEDWALSKILFMVQGSNTTVVKYQNTGTENIKIELHPLYSNKDYHSEFRENDFDFYYEKKNSILKIHAFPNSPALYCSWSKGTFTEHRSWYKNQQLEREAYRGLESVEDYYRIGYHSTLLKPGQSVSLLFSTEEKMANKNSAPPGKGHKLL